MSDKYRIIIVAQRHIDHILQGDMVIGPIDNFHVLHLARHVLKYFYPDWDETRIHFADAGGLKTLYDFDTNRVLCRLEPLDEASDK